MRYRSAVIRDLFIALLLTIALAPGLAAATQASAVSAAAAAGAAAAGGGDGQTARPDAAGYDLRSLVDTHPEYAALHAAYKSGRWSRVRALANTTARHTRDRDVWAAAIYLGWRACRHAGDTRCAAAQLAALAEKSAFSAHARLELASGKGLSPTARLAAIAALPTALSARYRLAVADGWRRHGGVLTPAHQAILQASAAVNPRAALSRTDRCRLDFMTGEQAARDSDGESADIDAAQESWLRVWQGGCGATGDLALERLAALGRPPTPLERVEAVAMSRRPTGRRSKRKAERKLLQRIEKIGAGTPGLPTYGRARLYGRDRQRREQALALFGQVAKLGKDPEVLAWSRYRAGHLLGLLGRDVEAIDTLEPLLQDSPPGDLPATVRWRLFRLYRAQTRWLDAEKMLTEVIATPNPWQNDALWELAWRRYRLGDKPEALTLLVELRGRVAEHADDGKQPWHARIDYWRARCHQDQGDSDAARALYESVVQRNPQTYYGIMALDRLGTIAPERAAQLANPPLSPTSLPLEVTQLLVQRHPLLDGPALLVRMGAYREASQLLRQIIPGMMPRDGVHLLAALYHLADRPRAAYAVLRRHARRAARPDATTAAVWRVAYATPFEGEFETAAREAGVARSLLYAVARHESHFIPTAKSRAGAVGLVQLLPLVARRIAELYGLPKRSDWWLRRPAWNLSIGARYLAQLNSFLGANHALVFAAYNAGPYAARKWLKRTGTVPTDEYVESIPYKQARNYARGVLATANAYATLHPEWRELGAIQAGRRPFVPLREGPFMVPLEPLKNAAQRRSEPPRPAPVRLVTNLQAAQKIRGL